MESFIQDLDDKFKYENLCSNEIQYVNYFFEFKRVWKPEDSILDPPYRIRICVKKKKYLFDNFLYVYFLILKEDIVYVGYTNSLIRRINEHLRLAEIPFNSFKFMVFRVPFQAKEMEKGMIKKLKPRYNKRLL